MARERSLSDQYARLHKRLDETALDPAAWRHVCDELASLVGAVGTLLIPYNVNDRTIAMPHSSNLDEVLHRFIETGWHKRDFRAQGFPKLIAQGQLTDQDIIEPEKMDRHPYYAELLAPAGLKWFASVSFEADGKLWGAAVHGTPGRGPFLANDVQKLKRMQDKISLAATRSALVGAHRLTSLETAFEAAARGVVVLDNAGKIISANAMAEDILRDGSLVMQRCLRSADATLDAKLAELVASVTRFSPDGAVVLPRPVLVPGRSGRLFSVDGVPMPRDFQTLLSGACAIVTLHEVAGTSSEGLRERFHMTAREAELAAHLAAGSSVGAAALAMGISVSTARHHLKSMFAKTGAHRQAELVAVLARSAA